MTELELALKKKLSFISSWEYISKEFTSQWEHLNRAPVNKQGEKIWQTRSKDVHLLEVPTETESFRVAFKVIVKNAFSVK